jgi:nitrogen regulatory protein PII
VLKKTLREVGVNGFTFFNVRGDGDSGFQSGQFESDSNVLFMVVLSHDKRETLLNKLAGLLKRGHHLTIFSLETEVFSPSKFD